MLTEAIKDYNNALLLKPNNIKVYIERALAYMNNEMYDKAIIDYNFIIKQGFHEKNFFYNRGFAYMHIKKFDLAIDDFKNCINIDPNFANAYYDCGFVYLQKGLIKEAKKSLLQAKKINPEYKQFVNEIISELNST